MGCTTVLVGKKATNDNTTMIARTDDGYFDCKKIIVNERSDKPYKYKSKIGHLEIELNEPRLRYTSSPSIDQAHGLWPATGINEKNVGMTATETITSNPRVLSLDPLVNYDSKTKKPGGIGEEDIVALVLPYINSAREGVIRLGSLLEKYGTYEMNGIAFNDENEVWWLETIGGHHFIARRVEDDEYVIMPNQFGLDKFDFNDAYSKQEKNICSKDLKEFVEKNNLYLGQDGNFNPRLAFGSHSDADHVYNTPRGWYMGRYFNPKTYKWDGENADFSPLSDDIPWSLKPEKKITIEDIKYILSSYYQGTEYNPYMKNDNGKRGIYRPIGIARTGITSICQIRSDVPDIAKGLEWISFGANPFNTMIPLYTNVAKMPKYFSDVTLDVSTENFYWSSRLLGALVDPHFASGILHIERYQLKTASKAREIVNKYDKILLEEATEENLNKANLEIEKMIKKETTDTLNKVLLDASIHMKCNYSRMDN